jgi:hypothetical protein
MNLLDSLSCYGKKHIGSKRLGLRSTKNFCDRNGYVLMLEIRNQKLEEKVPSDSAVQSLPLATMKYEEGSGLWVVEASNEQGRLSELLQP